MHPQRHPTSVFVLIVSFVLHCVHVLVFNATALTIADIIRLYDNGLPHKPCEIYASQIIIVSRQIIKV
jgi:hypothetical protein